MTDLSELEVEIGIGLHLKYRKYQDGSQHAFDPRTQRVMQLTDFDTKVAIYEDRVFGWFLDRAPAPETNGDYVALQVALSQVEGLVQYKRGKETPTGKAGDWFKASMKEVLAGWSPQDATLKEIWKAMRCGLFHTGFTNGPVFISPMFPEPVHHVGKNVYVNVQRLLNEVKRAERDYITTLRSGADPTLNANFEKFWDSQWGTAKAPHVIAALSTDLGKLVHSGSLR
jgi:hypothetical protein